MMINEVYIGWACAFKYLLSVNSNHTVNTVAVGAHANSSRMEEKMTREANE